MVVLMYDVSDQNNMSIYYTYAGKQQTWRQYLSSKNITHNDIKLSQNQTSFIIILLSFSW